MASIDCVVITPGEYEGVRFTSDERRRYAIALWLADYQAERPVRGLGGPSPDPWLRRWSVTKV